MTKVNLEPSFVDQLAAHMPGGFFIYSATGDEELLYINQQMLDIFGCGTEEEFREITGYTFRGLVHPDDIGRVEASIEKQIKNHKDNMDYVEYRIIRKDGSIRWVDDYGHYVSTEEYGGLFYVFINDSTEKHQIVDEAQREKEVIEGLSDSFSSVFLLDLDKGAMRPYRLQSEFARALVGDKDVSEHREIDWNTILSDYAKRYVHAADRQRFLEEISAERIGERLAAEKQYTFSYRIVTKDERLLYMEMWIVRIGGERHSHAVMGYRDVTEAAQRVQRETAERLEMEEALERQKRANEAKNTFLFNISHDIRTPMNSIMGFTELAKRHIHEPDALAGYLEKVDVSNKHMLSLIDDLLEMSQIDTGQTKIKTEIAELSDQLSAVVEMLRPQAEDKGILLETDNRLPDEKVYVDPLRFRRVIANLLSNAIKFTPENGEVKVTAFPKHVSKSGYARYVFAIQDNGIGMSEEFMARMFEAFEREETSTQTGYIGTGLGLSITKRLLDIMGGSIEVESTKGKGSTFTVSLPLKLAEEENKKPKTDAAEPQPQGAEFSEQKRILLVEDIEINRLLAENILQEGGFLVESVPDGCDAVERVENSPEYYYDLILMDIQMPVMNGYEATRVIRSLGRADTDRLPIIALSANAREEDKRESIESGMNSHVAKPFDVDKLIQTINEHIQENESRGQ